MARYSGSGWHRQSKRHSNAKKYGKADFVNLGRYAGTWEQKKVVNEPIFQRGCERVTATYTPMSKGRIKVTNRCYRKDKPVKKIVGTARSVSKNNRKLKVSFFPPFEGDYNIKKINPSYTKAVVKSGKVRWELKKIR
jgi:apolipoprotein D and lipocalin family protein